MPKMKTLTIGGVTFEVSDPEAVLIIEQNLPEEQREQARENIGAPRIGAYVKTVNGSAPDASGNVQIKIPDSGGTMSDYDIFRQNMTLDYGYDAETGTSYTNIRVYKKKTDGRLQYPFVFAPNGDGAPIYSGLDVATAYGFLLTINAGCGGTFGSPNGTLIQGGTVIQQGPTEQHPTALPLTIDNNGDLWYAAADADAADMVANGIVSAVCGFMPIIKDYKAVPDTEWNAGIDHYTMQAQRQIIGQYANGDYAIITCEGRNFANSPGWTIAQAQSICISLGLKFAYNLDGGGSTSVVIGKKQLNLIYEGATGRKVPAFIVFNGGTVAPGADVPDEPDVPDVPDIELPAGYTLLDYIEVDGKQYVSSGIPETTDIGVEYAFSPNQNNGTNSSGHMLSSANIYAPYLRYQESGARDIIAQRFGNQQKFSYTFADNVKYTVKAYLGGTDDILVNDSFVGTCAKGTATLSATNMLYLFAYGGDLNGTRFRASGKFYYMKIYDADGELIRHLVPCANASSVVGLFDVVNEVFYRSASGIDFIYSGYLPEPDVPDVPDVELPDGYTLLDYIEVDGKQYVNSGISETTDIAVKYAFAPNQNNGTNSSGHMLSSANIYAPYLRYQESGARDIIAQRFGNQQKFSYTFADNVKYTVKAYLGGTDDILVNDSFVGTCAKGTGTLSASNMLYLFAYGGNLDTTRFRASGKFYYMQIYSSDGELIRHFVPCENADQVGGLFDIVNEVFYRSASGTDFIIPV